MVTIQGFNGIRYDGAKVAMNAVVAPPYDVIDDTLHTALEGRSPYNVVNLILNRIKPTDTERESRYTRARALLDDWTAQGILKSDSRPGLYYYTQEFTGKHGETLLRKGFIGALELVEFGKGSVYPHEKTLSKPKEDRLKLFKSTGVNLSPIFTIYSDPAKRVDSLFATALKGVAPITIESGNDVIDRFYPVFDRALIAEVGKIMADTKLYIADGHHRYDTGLAYRDYVRSSNGNAPGPHDSIMSYFANMDDEGMVVFPTHRVIHSLTGFDGTRILDELAKYFDIVKLGGASDATFIADLEKIGEIHKSIGCIIKGDPTRYILSIKENELERRFPTVPKQLRNLDVTILHRLILSDILKLSEESVANQINLHYVKDTHKAFVAMESGDYQIGFILNATKIHEIEEVAAIGEVMPQKSTFFYPKLLSGLVIKPLS